MHVWKFGILRLEAVRIYECPLLQNIADNLRGNISGAWKKLCRYFPPKAAVVRRAVLNLIVVTYQVWVLSHSTIEGGGGGGKDRLTFCSVSNEAVLLVLARSVEHSRVEQRQCTY